MLIREWTILVNLNLFLLHVKLQQYYQQKAKQVGVNAFRFIPSSSCYEDGMKETLGRLTSTHNSF